MRVYVAVCEDRHIDPEIYVFVDRGKAIDCARQFMREHIAYPDNVYEDTIEGYEIVIGYKLESDQAYVVACDVIK